MIREYGISELHGRIAWSYFYHAWGLSSASGDEKDQLRRDALAMLAEWEGGYCSKALFEYRSANAETDDIVIEGTVFPMLRQQNDDFICLADYIKPTAMGEDRIGLFATTMDNAMPELSSSDPYERMLAQTIADRLAEATAEMVSRDMPGLRVAVGYPSMPDMSINFLIDKVIGMQKIGIGLTESGMMMPHASVSGLVFAHPKARYFDIRGIGEDQLADYSIRRGFSTDDMRRFIRNVQ